MMIIPVFFIFLLAQPVNAELCSSRVDKDVKVRGGFEWQWRMIDGRKCWYLAERSLPNADLIWEYDSQQFDSDGVVRERKFYSPEELRR